MSSQSRAIVIESEGNAQIKDVPIPELPNEEFLLVRPIAVGINPADWKHIDYAGVLDAIGTQVGGDYAGVVVKVGSKVTRPYKVGDRVFGFANASHDIRKEESAFSDYAIVKGDLQLPVPDNITAEQAATLGVGLATVGQGLYQCLGLPFPNAPTKEPAAILIYGGSTATGILGIQLAKLSGYKVVTTASPRNKDYLLSLGADAVIDYNSPNVVEEIRAAAGLPIYVAWDCYAEGKAPGICAKALEDDPKSHYAGIQGGCKEAAAAVNSRIKTSFTLAYTIFNEARYNGKNRLEASPENFEFAKKILQVSYDLLAAGRFQPARVILNRGGKGLEGVLVGLDESRKGKVSGGKLVYQL